MKNILLGLFLLASVSQAQAQERFFKLLEGWKAERVIETDSSYVVVGLNNYQWHNYYQFSSLTKIGDSLNAWSFDIDTFSELNIYTSHDILPCDNKWLIMGAGYLPTNTKGTALIFNSALSDTLLVQTLFYETATILRCPIAISNGYACLAECYKSNGDMYMKWLMLDSNLVVISSNDYHPTYTNTQNKLTPTQLQQTIDGGYLISCLEQTFSNNSDIQRPVLIKTNSQGVQEWRRPVGNINYLCEGGYAAATPDGGWLVAWSAPRTVISDPNMEDGINIEKRRPNGTREWTKHLGWFMDYQTDNNIYYLRQFQALPDGNYLVSGYSNKRGILLKITPNGDPIWYRPIDDPFSADNAGVFTEVQINSVTPTSDGGFICAGEYHSDAGGLFPNFVQSAFAMKLDEYGCLEPGCQVADAVEEVDRSSGGIKVYPNPAQQFTVFEYRLQENAHNPSISIWTTTGTLLSQRLLGSTEGIWTWDTQQVPDGLYFYTLSDTNGVISTGKIAVQH